MYIIWKYDSFPYRLCGKVKENLEDGYYTVERYDGMKFKAICAITDEQGERVVKMLEDEKIAQRKAQKALDTRFENRVKVQLLNILGR